MATLADAWTLGDLRVPNRVLLAPLAGIGNWFVRLQAKRYGAGMAVSEMVSSHAIHYGNRRTLRELLRIDPRERDGGPISIQLFGQDPEIMRSAARTVAAAGADVIDLNMGCPVPKVCKTGAGAALLADPDRAVALARAARIGSGLPVTVKLRSGRRPGDVSGVELARRLVAEGGVSAIAIHPRSASERHRGRPDYALAARLAQTLDAPVILTGGLREAGSIQEAFAATGVAAVMLARGSLGNPWLFRSVLRASAADRTSSGAPEGTSSCGEGSPEDGARLLRSGGARLPEAERLEPAPDAVVAELEWVMERACEHLGEERAGRYLRKFYPWYVARLGLERGRAAALQAALQTAPRLDDARLLMRDAAREVPDGAGLLASAERVALGQSL